jgi:hypothetical protein
VSRHKTPALFAFFESLFDPLALRRFLRQLLLEGRYLLPSRFQGSRAAALKLKLLKLLHLSVKRVRWRAVHIE